MLGRVTVSRLSAIAAVALCLALPGCGGGHAGSAPLDAATLANQPWASIVARARGTSVIWRMWRGDPAINSYVDDWVAPRMRSLYGVEVRAVEGQGAELVPALPPIGSGGEVAAIDGGPVGTRAECRGPAIQRAAAGTER